MALNWGVWWGLGLERPAWASLSPDLIRDQERDGLLPAGSAAQLGGVIVSRRARGTLRPELVIAAGPQRRAQPGGGTFAELYGGRWALGLYKGGPRLYQAQAGVWVDRIDPDALAELSGARHVALAWDQAARPVVAWERDALVYVRQWSAQNAQYVTRGPWVGREPLLTCDALSGVPVSDSDVLLLHLSGAQLVARVQREGYDVARVQLDAAATVLDQLVPLPLGWQVVGASAAGDPVVIRSALYPAAVSAAVSGAVSGPAGGALVPVLVTQTSGGALTGAASGPTAGGYYDQGLIPAARSAAVSGAASGPAGGALMPVLVTQTSGGALTGAASGPAAGSYAASIISHNSGGALTGAVSGPAQGSYYA